MLQKLNNRKESGFTIIEVLIVLAIAGLIIAIVLFAVPQLQRNGRNTGIKNDANSLAGYKGDFASNFDGASPKGVAVSSGTVTLCSVVTNPCPGTAQKSTGKLQGSTDINLTTITDPSATTTTGLVTGTLYVTLGKTCENVGSTRAMAITYLTEGSGGNARKCLDS